MIIHLFQKITLFQSTCNAHLNAGSEWFSVYTQIWNRSLSYAWTRYHKNVLFYNGTIFYISAQHSTTSSSLLAFQVNESFNLGTVYVVWSSCVVHKSNTTRNHSPSKAQTCAWKQTTLRSTNTAALFTFIAQRQEIQKTKM